MPVYYYVSDGRKKFGIHLISDDVHSMSARLTEQGYTVLGIAPGVFTEQ